MMRTSEAGESRPCCAVLNTQQLAVATWFQHPTIRCRIDGLGIPPHERLKSWLNGTARRSVRRICGVHCTSRAPLFLAPR